MKKELLYMDSDSMIFGHVSIIDKIKSRIHARKEKFNAWKKERIENGTKIAFEMTTANQQAMDRILNIGKRKK